METVHRINVEFSFTKRKALVLLTFFFLCWRPGSLGSESLTMTTYYPAPYGGYARLLTTNQAVLARDGGNVGIGTDAPSAKLHVAGGFRLANGSQAVGRVLTSDAVGNSTWTTPPVGLDCSWSLYWSWAATNCPGAGTRVVLAARDWGGRLYPPDGSAPTAGYMLCCLLK